MVDKTEPAVESDLRRRAAWLLVMLAVVAVLFVVVLSAVIGSGGKNHHQAGPGPLDSAIGTEHPSTHSAQRSGSSSGTGSTTGSTASTGQAASCPTAQRCALDADIGDAIAAVNAYRTQHGQAAVPGTVSAAAKACALNNGNGCTGGWAESQVPGPDGTTAVRKIVQLGKLLDPGMKSFGVGWAYDPAGKAYYFAIVRND